MAAELKEKWWKDNKAKTLLKTGVSDALRKWEKELSNTSKHKSSTHNKKELLAALDNLDKAVGGAIKKASKKIHKTTINHLKEYQTAIANAKAIINKADGEFDNKSCFTKPVHDILKNDKMFQMYWDTYGFIYEIKKNGNKGSSKICDEYIKKGSKYEINIDKKLQDAIVEKSASGEFDLDAGVKDERWGDAYKQMLTLWKSNTQIPGFFTRIKIGQILSGLKKM